MKYRLLFIFILIALISCNDKCDDVQQGTAHSIDAFLQSDSAIGFTDNGFTKFKVVETDSMMRIGQIRYDNNVNLERIYLPLAHNYTQTTFVFTGDTVSPETLVVGDYNARIEFTNECRYALKIDKPKVKKCTFKSYSIGNFSSYNQNLQINLDH